MVLNVLSQAQTRYIPVRVDLETFLKGKYCASYNFNIQVRLLRTSVRARILTAAEHNLDRWSFEAPETVSEVCCPGLQTLK